MAVEIPTKLTVPEDIDMSNPADIREIWNEIQIIVPKINEVIDVLSEHDTSLNDSVYHEED